MNTDYQRVILAKVEPDADGAFMFRELVHMDPLNVPVIIGEIDKRHRDPM